MAFLGEDYTPAPNEHFLSRISVSRAPGRVIIFDDEDGIPLIELEPHNELAA